MATVNLSAVITPSNVLTDSNTVSGITNKTFTSPAITTSITTASTSFTALAGATTLLTLGGTGASSVLAIPGTLEQSSTTGALTVAGGVYIAKKLNVVGVATLGTGAVLGTPASGNLANCTGIPAGSAATPTALGTVYAKQTTSGGTPFLTAFGYNAGVATTGVGNTAVGVSSLQTNSTGSDSTAIGYRSLYTNNGANNTAVGSSALYLNSTGVSNTAVGLSALENTTNSYNAAVGTYALQANTSGDSNVGMGYQALTLNQTGIDNIGIGRDALGKVISGSSNTAVGRQALYNNTASNNTAIGYQASINNTTATANVSLGYYALRLTNTGGYNTAVGYEAGKSNTVGTESVYVGAYAGNVDASAGQNTCVGYAAGIALSAAGFNTLLGRYAGSVMTAGIGSVAIGDSAGKSCNKSVYIGRNAGATSAGVGNIFLGIEDQTTATSAAGCVSIGAANNLGNEAAVFAISTQANRISMGSTSTTNAYVQVAWTVVSDARDKMNFAPVPHGLDFVNKLNPVAFQFKEARDIEVPNGPVRYGFKAQEILALEGDAAVIIDNEHSEKLRYNGEALVPVLVKALQELNAKFDAYVLAHP